MSKKCRIVGEGKHAKTRNVNDIVHCEFQNEIITAIDIIYDNGKSMLETSRKRIRHVIGTLKKKK